MNHPRWILALLMALLLGTAAVATAQDAKMNALLTAVKADPNDANARFNLGVEYLNRRLYDLAIPEFERTVKLNSKDKEAKEFLAAARGIQAYLNKDYENAVEQFRDTLKINPQNQNANQLLGNAYLHLKDYDKAEKAYLTYLSAFPNDKETIRIANQNLSNLYIDQKRYPEALAALKRQLAVDPKSFDAHNNMGVAFFYQRDYPAAVASWEKALKIKKNAQTYKFLGYSYYNLGKFQDATSRYEASLKMDKSDPELHYNLAVAYYDNAQYDNAASAFGAALKLNPNDSNAATGQAQAIETAINSHMEKGSNLYLNNEYSKAVEEWQAVLKYQPDHKEAQAFLSDARGKLKGEVDRRVKAGKDFAGRGKNVDALRELNLAISMDPTNQEARDAIAQLKVKRSEKIGSYIEQGDDYLSGKDYAAAILKYRAALRVNPDDPKVKTRLSKAKSLQKQEFQRAFSAGKKASAAKNYTKAIQSYEEAKRLYPESSDAGELLFQARARMRSRVKDLLDEGMSLYSSGDKEKARERFLAVVTLDQGNESANEYIRKMTGQQSKAKVDSEKIRALYYEGVNLYINGKIHEAIARWKECLKLDPNYPNAKKNIDKAYVKLQSIQKLGQN